MVEHATQALVRELDLAVAEAPSGPFSAVCRDVRDARGQTVLTAAFHGDYHEARRTALAVALLLTHAGQLVEALRHESDFDEIADLKAEVRSLEADLDERTKEKSEVEGERDKAREALAHIASGGISPSISGFAQRILDGATVDEAHRAEAARRA